MCVTNQPLWTASSPLPTLTGQATIKVFKFGTREHVALIFGDQLQTPTLVRVHSSCLTGETLGSTTCDCGPQLQTALKILGELGGVMIYLQQEGRGIGLTDKIRAYALQQDEGMDTYQANRALGHQDDEREYEAAVEMLSALDVTSVRLMTNNPRKVKLLQEGGIQVAERVPIVTKPLSDRAARYMRSKATHAGHSLSDEELSSIDERHS